MRFRSTTANLLAGLACCGAVTASAQVADTSVTRMGFGYVRNTIRDVAIQPSAAHGVFATVAHGLSPSWQWRSAIEATVASFDPIPNTIAGTAYFRRSHRYQPSGVDGLLRVSAGPDRVFTSQNARLFSHVGVSGSMYRSFGRYQRYGWEVGPSVGVGVLLPGTWQLMAQHRRAVAWRIRDGGSVRRGSSWSLRFGVSR